MIKWGVLGLGNIANRFCESLTHFNDAIFYAGASYTESKRQQFADQFHPVHVYDNYDSLLNDEDIDIVYIAVPHGHHFEWIMEALKHGKNVMSEKPAVLTKEEMETIQAYAVLHHLFFMEAMKARFIPLIRLLHEEIDHGTIGEITSIDNHFTFDMPYIERHYMFDPVQGGTLYDAGCYGLAFIQDFIKSDIKDIHVEYVKNYGVDVHQNTHITYISGQTADTESAIDDPANKRFGVIYGTKGKITIDPFYRPTHADIELNDGTIKTLDADYEYDDFHSEIAAANEGVRQGLVESPLMTHQDSIAYIDLMAQIKAAMK